jgi:hypothetical protein
MRRYVMILVGLSCALAGCKGDIAHGSRVPVPDPPRDWTVVSSEPGHCGCPNGRQFFLVNLRGKRDSIVIKEIRNDILGGTTQALAAFPEVEPGTSGRKFLKCSPENANGNQCNIEYQWDVDGVVYNQNSRLVTPTFRSKLTNARLIEALDAQAPLSSKAAAMSALAAIQTGVTSIGRTDCVVACRTGSKDCLRTSLVGAQGDPTNDIVRLVRVQGTQGRIPVADLLAALQQKANPCERSDLTVSNGFVSNTGYACQWIAGAGTPLEVEVRIPGTLAGQLVFPGDRLKATFPKAELFGPSLHFKNSAVDAEFGGIVYALEEASFPVGGKDRRFIVASGRSSCVALNAN